ncbi:fluoride efflux transporter CrcB [Thermomicrobiaceae bacterium CFH 74404]|uniref:Fluoride-specific ion channel FluC n=1 Tax=Thermalbibacter longus TaxID=2951981 RepID=A0AA41WAL8_9BACT|nr:fluoride efflux transporter CrcB [Thermalbibacter longus]MCM8747787.1 fluoride efflux transporter CrcB [Thermalbibacter longus]
MTGVLLVAIGGAAGSVARYLASTSVQRNVGISFPLGTFIINVTGSFLIGVILGLFEAGNLSPAARLLIAVGFLGGFTTFSSFSYESLLLLESKAVLPFLLNTVGSVVAGLAAAWLGVVLVRIMAAVLRGHP